jgi:hypothetical protein
MDKMNMKLLIVSLLVLSPYIAFSVPLYIPMNDSPNFEKLHGFIVVPIDVISHPDEMIELTKENFFKALREGRFTSDYKILKKYPSIVSFYRYGSFSFEDGSIFMWRMHRPDLITVTDEEGREGYILCPPGLPIDRKKEKTQDNP